MLSLIITWLKASLFLDFKLSAFNILLLIWSIVFFQWYCLSNYLEYYILLDFIFFTYLILFIRIRVKLKDMHILLSPYWLIGTFSLSAFGVGIQLNDTFLFRFISPGDHVTLQNKTGQMLERSKLFLWRKSR